MLKVTKEAQRKGASQVVSNATRAFGHGPYNPLQYKAHLVPEQLPR